MTSRKLQTAHALKAEIAGIIEPVANYIAAADRPQETLRTALALLCDEVQDTSRAALTHVLWTRTNL